LAAPHLSNVLGWSSALVLFTTLQGTYNGALAGFEAFRSLAWVNVMTGLLGAPLIVAGARILGLPGAVVGCGLQALIGCIVSHTALFNVARRAGICLAVREFSRRDFSSADEREMLWRFSLPALLSSTLVGPVNWFCNAILANQTEGYRQVALLSAANQWRNFVAFLPVTLSSVMMPMIADLHANGRQADVGNLVRRQIAMSFGLCAAVALPLCLSSGPLMLLYGSDFRKGVPVLVITLLSTGLTAVNNLLSKSLQSAGRAWTDCFFSAIWATALVLASLVSIPPWAAMGVVFSQAVAALVLAICQWQTVRRLFAPAAAQ
jgi:O-antigen/teichoic acid export membrane protein